MILAVSIGFALFATTLVDLSGPGKLLDVLRATTGGVLSQALKNKNVMAIVASFVFWAGVEASASSIGLLVCVSLIGALFLMSQALGMGQLILIALVILVSVLAGVPAIYWAMTDSGNVITQVVLAGGNKFESARVVFDYGAMFVVRSLGTAGFTMLANRLVGKF